MRARVAFVVARASNGVIGAAGATPWKLRTDMARFRTITMGKPVVMGRKTWAALKAPLTGRDNIVVTRDAALRATGAWTFSSLDAALACARARATARRVDEIAIVGGADIFRQALPLADRIHLTEVHASVAGDTVFPKLDGRVWREVSACDAPAGDGDDHAMTFRILERAT